MLVGGQVPSGPEKGLARVADARDSDLGLIHFALWSGSDFLLTRLYRHGLSIWPDGILVRRPPARPIRARLHGCLSGRMGSSCDGFSRGAPLGGPHAPPDRPRPSHGRTMSFPNGQGGDLAGVLDQY